MKKGTVNISGNNITITQHGKDDYEIYRDDNASSLRGTATDILNELTMGNLYKVKELAEKNFGEDEPDFTVAIDDMAVTDVWYDLSARFPLSDDDAFEEWGIEGVVRFCLYCLTKLDVRKISYDGCPSKCCDCERKCESTIINDCKEHLRSVLTVLSEKEIRNEAV